MPVNSLETYRFVAPLSQNTRLKLDDQAGLGSNGQRNVGNLFPRAWDCITRSGAQIQTNKEITRDFVRALREEYGDEIANTMARDLSAQLSNGRPLTGYRIGRVLENADRLSSHIQANNRALLDECLDELTDLALRRIGDDTHPGVLNRDQARQVLRQAIEGSPAFQQQSFHNILHHLMDTFGDDGAGLARQEFIQHYQGKVDEMLEHDISLRLLPDTTRLRDAHGLFTIGHVVEKLTGEDYGRVLEIEAQMHATIRESVRIDDRGPSSVGNYVGMIEFLQDGAATLRQLDRTGMDDVGKAYLDALLNDVTHLLTLLNDRLGTKGFTPEQMRALMEVNREAGQFALAITEGDLEKTARQCPGMQRRIRDGLEVLRGMQPGDEKSRLTLQAIIARGERTLTMSDDYQIAVRHGLRGSDLSSSTARSEEILARLGENGFDGQDIAWMRGHGLNVGDTVMRFSLEQVRQLKRQGLDIEHCLQSLT